MGLVTPKAPLEFLHIGVAPGEVITGEAIAPARCDYCGRYGPLGQCEGCGAPNAPTRRRQLLDITQYGDRKRQLLDPNTGETFWEEW